MIALKERDADGILATIRDIMNAKTKEKLSEEKTFDELSESFKKNVSVNKGKLPFADMIVDMAYAKACKIHQMQTSKYEREMMEFNRIIELLTIGSENVQ